MGKIVSSIASCVCGVLKISILGFVLVLEKY